MKPALKVLAHVKMKELKRNVISTNAQLYPSCSSQDLKQKSACLSFLHCFLFIVCFLALVVCKHMIAS